MNWPNGRARQSLRRIAKSSASARAEKGGARAVARQDAQSGENETSEEDTLRTHNPNQTGAYACGMSV